MPPTRRSTRRGAAAEKNDDAVATPQEPSRRSKRVKTPVSKEPEPEQASDEGKRSRRAAKSEKKTAPKKTAKSPVKKTPPRNAKKTPTKSPTKPEQNGRRSSRRRKDPEEEEAVEKPEEDEDEAADADVEEENEADAEAASEDAGGDQENKADAENGAVEGEGQLPAPDESVAKGWSKAETEVSASALCVLLDRLFLNSILCFRPLLHLYP